ncbi:MAG: transglycosylase domain-containing protein, partial [Anaerolineales bacterium]|nr:transglycosylase domain-containing protein [Anaerolineales bacterium]
MMRRRIYLWVAGVLLVALAFSGLGVFWLYRDLPDVDTLPARLHTPSVRILDRNGRLLYEALDEQSGRHTVVALERIPLACQSAAVATEDRSFYRNPGFDLRGVLRSVWINLRGGEALAGGSTITQQAARNLLMDDKERGERTLRRKLREVILAWELTRKFSKDDILAMYLNQTYYGGMAYGIEAAAQTFFGKPVERLDLAECALLAGLPQAPALYNPFSDLEAARKRQAIVLGLMEEAGMISPEERSLAERERLVFAEQPYPIEAPHFVMQVRSQIDGLLSQQEVYDLGGLEVRTTIDLDWQKHAERAVLRQIEAMQRSNQGLGHDMNNAALVALDPKNGDILAMVGSPDYFDPEHGGAINMALSPRQPGSALKPLVYAAALDPHEAGGGWTAATMLLDVQTAFVTRAGKAYVPANYDLREHGPVLLREALGSSLNIPAVRTLEHVGLDQLFSLSRKMGLTTLGDPQEYDLSVALGGGAVRLLDLTSAYAAFASEGVRVQPRYILEISDLGGNEVYKAPDPARTRIIDARVAWLISDILSDNNARRLGFGANSVLRLDRPAAVKTGTTTNFHDNWTIGYTPDLVVGVWAGNTDYKPMREVNGLTGAAPIWHEFMRTVLAGRPKDWFVRPQGLVQVEVCALSGLLPTESCP